VESRTITALDVITAFAVLTPATPRRARRFFRVRSPSELPRLADHPAYFGLAKFYLSQPFQPSTRGKVNAYGQNVNARFWCNSTSTPVHPVDFNVFFLNLL